MNKHILTSTFKIRLANNHQSLTELEDGAGARSSLANCKEIEKSKLNTGT